MRRPAPTAALLALALAACPSEEAVERPPPTDRFYHPIGVATTPVTGAAGGTALLVASSNFDLRYSEADGGTLLAVDPDDSDHPAILADPGAPMDVLDAARFGSYGGPVAAVDDRTCPAAAPSVLVASRFTDVLYRLALDAGTGALGCGAGCEIDLGGSRPGDPFAVAVACDAAETFQRAYVGFLDTPDTASSTGDSAWVAEVDLSGAAAPRILEFGDGPVRALAWEPGADRLWLAARSSGARAYLYEAVVTSAAWRDAPREAVGKLDLYPFMEGVELKAIAVGTPVAATTRLYATARLYDPEYQADHDARPAGDIGGVLLILDVDYDGAGRPVLSGFDWRDLGAGAGDVAVVRRSAGRDVVVATVLDRDTVAVYDDATGAFGFEEWPDPLYGVPTLGSRPVALAVDQPPGGVAPGGSATVYVASFEEHLVNRFVLAFGSGPADPPALGALETIGGIGP